MGYKPAIERKKIEREPLTTQPLRTDFLVKLNKPDPHN